MIQLHVIPCPDFTWLVLEQSMLPMPSDFSRLEGLCQQNTVEGTKGVGIAATPSANPGLIGLLYSHYRNRCQWQGSYGQYQVSARKKVTGILITQVIGKISELPVAKHEVIECLAPCIQCWKDTGELLPTKSLYFYCEKHRTYSPHRSGSRRKKI